MRNGISFGSANFMQSPDRAISARISVVSGEFIAGFPNSGIGGTDTPASEII